jgi:hypothetical protein
MMLRHRPKWGMERERERERERGGVRAETTHAHIFTHTHGRTMLASDDGENEPQQSRSALTLKYVPVHP